ncbi:ABC transporter [Palaeococcus pacificus DY20341]|uniref:Molybdate/tungstate import ATP-binding protein WtpC n=1 Tax=Palaeococcus pacificus DY20341 TaxID=1343739 RepID=A0A075LVF0_9EURY|nr:betaine/proline/choline family ABC transporter ATP-binding protein [Palaeococcus pacificus]AIF68448.1 ABC transporter [Palaeococcus pacificus DY20341]
MRLFDKIEKVELNGVTKRYGDFVAVDHVDLEVVGGELLILIGPSGSGKTTTLRMINRLVELDEGEITINGQNIMSFNPIELRRNIGYAIQQIGLFPHMTVRGNIGLLAKLEGWSDEEIDRRVRELLELVDLPPEQFMNRYPRQLSGGQQQRVGLARAFMLDPPLLLMDEPFGALDPILRKQLQEEFLEIKEKLGRTIIFVTHDIEEAFKLGDRIAVMKDGKLIQVGAPDELVLNPANEFVAKLVNADKKFKHMDTLRVGDVMRPIEEKYLFEWSLTVKEAINLMTERGVEFGIVVERGEYQGIIELKTLLRLDGERKLGDSASEALSFTSKDNLASSLQILKIEKASIAIVVENHKPIGMLLADEVLLRLI